MLVVILTQKKIYCIVIKLIYNFFYVSVIVNLNCNYIIIILIFY